MLKKLTILLIICMMALSLAGCNFDNTDRVIIYSNADDEALTAMENALDNNGYAGQYILQSFSTSELGGRLIAEGTKMEADLVTMSSYFLDQAQNENEMFADLAFDHTTLENKDTAYSSPITAQEGALMVNTEALAENNLDMPKSIKDLADSQYAGFISIPDITGSSTGWLLVQSIIGTYGEEEDASIMTSIIDNAGPHMESSGSAPYNKVRSGEVAIAFGLRHQGRAAQNNGEPIEVIDPEEGCYSLTESIAVIDKGDKTDARAMAMAQCIIENAQPELLETYPLPIYPGETSDPEAVTKNPKVFDEPLTIDLLQRHQEFSENCKYAN